MQKTSTIASSPVLKTCKRPVNFDDVVLKALFERMDPETRTVTPQWRTLASSLGVCTMTLSRCIHQLKEDGRIETVEESWDGRSLLRPLGSPHDGRLGPTWLPNSRKRYLIKENVDADWAASVKPQFERRRVAKSHRPVQRPAEIFTGLFLENFKNSGRREIRFGRIAAVNGKSGADRAQVFDAMRLLHDIAHGRDVSAFPALWFGADWPTTLSISLNTLRHGKLTYSVTIQRVDDNRVCVTDERLTDEANTLLVRGKHFYTLSATKDKYGVGNTSFAIYDADGVLPADDPVAQFKRRLGELWLLNPDPNAMKSEIGFGIVKADAGDFSDFVTCMAVQQKRPEIASAMRDAVLRLCPGLTGYAVERNAKGVPCFAVRHRSDLDSKGTPFALLDNAEKMLFLVAFVCVMNGRADHTPVVWLSPFNWLGERERADADRLVRSAFANRGQMIMLV